MAAPAWMAAPTPTGGLPPSAALAGVIGTEPVARTEATKKLWDYIKAHNLQDAKDKRSINADAKLKPVFGKDQVTMFEIAKVLSNHLS
jgi:DNA topoisomerase-3